MTAKRVVDLRSDTVTVPTDEMRAAMAGASVGDDVYGEDPTVNALQEKAASLLGKEAALFVSSGTMGNQLAVLSQTRPGNEIICERSSHIFANEVGALARICGVQAVPIAGVRGELPLGEVESGIQEDDIHHPETALICVENTHNEHGGVVLSMDYLSALRALADRHGLPIHMDGARLFNAAVALDVPVAEIARYADTVTFCLSKGLCAPVGSMLCGSAAVIAGARKFRKMLGGGTRQAGILPAAGIIALDTADERLARDHQNAREFAQLIARIPGVTVCPMDTNIVYFDLPVSADTPAVVAALRGEGVRLSQTGARRIRAVTHEGIDGDDVAYSAQCLAECLAH